MMKTETQIEEEMKQEKVILVIKAMRNLKTGKVEIMWDFPESVNSSYLIGAIEMVKHDVLNNWCNKAEEEMEDE